MLSYLLNKISVSDCPCPWDRERPVASFHYSLRELCITFPSQVSTYLSLISWIVVLKMTNMVRQGASTLEYSQVGSNQDARHFFSSVCSDFIFAFISMPSPFPFEILTWILQIFCGEAAALDWYVFCGQRFRFLLVKTTCVNILKTINNRKLLSRLIFKFKISRGLSGGLFLSDVRVVRVSQYLFFFLLPSFLSYQSWRIYWSKAISK